jgi:hypothetical protein
MARFVEERSPHRFAACPAYPDYYPERTGATAGGRCLDMELADLSAMAPQARQVRVPDDGGCQNDPAFLIFDEEFTRRYSLPGFSSGAVPAWLE